MSTDDLTARVRDHLAHADTLPHGLAIALVSELADEVARLRESLAEAVIARNYAMRQRDEEARAKEGNIEALNTAVIGRLSARAEADRYRTLWDRHGKNDLLAEVDLLRGERDRWKARSVTAGADLDAARAALERVRGVAESEDRRDDEGNHVDLNDDTRAYLTRALEGEPS